MEGEENGDYTKDGTVDLRGYPVRRSKRGGWTACSFVVVYEVLERMTYCGISSNLVLYLTRKLHQGTVTASNNVTYWNGAVWMTPVIGAYIADAHLTRYWTFLIASFIYLVGMCLLTASVSVPGLRPPPCTGPNPTSCRTPTTSELAVFFTALYTLAIGTGGTKPNISTIGADQFDDFSPKEKAQKISFFNWWMFSIFSGVLFGNTVIVYLQDNVGWPLGHKKPHGSPFTRMARVIVAASRKSRVPIPENTGELYELEDVCNTKGKFKLESTPALRFLNKACVKTNSKSPWMLCSVTEVEETKQILKMLPILISTFIPSVMIAQTNTLFIKQGVTLDGRMSSHFKLPPASLSTFVTLTLLTCLLVYDRVFVKIARKWTKNPRGITLLQRLGIGFSLHIIIMAVASVTERYRLNMAKKYGLVESGGQVPLTIFILLPQFILMGVADACSEVAKLEFFYDQAPESMKSLGTSFYSTSMGIGSILSSFILSGVARVTRSNSHKGWILNNLNASRLDLYFAFLAVLSFLNFIAFLVIARWYRYKVEVSDSMEALKEKLEI
ncbi:protein NRT1/ PTR FAMILY 5.2-like isoform X2 [Andrographis paniculata]|uniref:protein NRT1/ PTR FAMILY 5.2-like isoform X2 n=1 Tax=Andrographis paniculata TaxID=175694 RepID=UPI0021E785EB|nr:protein NRT1/ PTR FAMILY 5.2-like isoform X2 [Andrographis paniculata]